MERHANREENERNKREREQNEPEDGRLYTYTLRGPRGELIFSVPIFHHAVSRQEREAKYGKGGEICPSISIKRKRRGSHLRVFMPERLKVALEGILAFEMCRSRGK